MQHATLFATLLTCLCATQVLAQDDKPLSPPEVSSQWVVVQTSENGRISMRFASGFTPKKVMKRIGILVPVTSVDDQGKRITEMHQEFRLVEEEVKRDGDPDVIRWSAEDLLFMNPSGQQLDFAKDVADRIKKLTPAMAVSEEDLPEYFTQVLRPETLVIVIPVKRRAPR